MEAKITHLMTTLEVTRKGAERITEVINTGAEILIEQCFSSLTKRRIAKRPSIIHGNVSYSFPTRENLWHAVIDFNLNGYY